MPLEPPKRFEAVEFKREEQQILNLPCRHPFVCITGKGRGVCVSCRSKVRRDEVEFLDYNYLDRTGSPRRMRRTRWVEDSEQSSEALQP